jgi:hypothetical protein
MTPLDQVFAQPTGARFYRADLHIHCFGGSHDVQDSSMAPAAVVITTLNATRMTRRPSRRPGRSPVHPRGPAGAGNIRSAAPFRAPTADSPSRDRKFESISLRSMGQAHHQAGSLLAPPPCEPLYISFPIRDTPLIAAIEGTAISCPGRGYRNRRNAHHQD